MRLCLKKETDHSIMTVKPVALMASNLEMLVPGTGEKQKNSEKTFGEKGGNAATNLNPYLREVNSSIHNCTPTGGRP